jgi:uncharacterized Tic20 family protein
VTDYKDPPSSPPPYEPPHATAAPGEITAEARQWAMFAHLSALAGFVIPFGNVLGPLVIWLVKKDTMPFVDDQAKESLNFQISVTIAVIISMALIILLIGIPLLFVVGLVALVLTIMAGIKANEGVTYRYPFTLRLIK